MDICEQEMPCTARDYGYANKCAGIACSPGTKEEVTLLKQFSKVRILNVKRVDIEGKTVHERKLLEVAHIVKDRLGKDTIIWHEDHVVEQVIEVLLGGA